MSRWRPFLETIHLTVIGICTGAILMSGVAAAIIFPALKGLEPDLPGFAAYEGDHWRIAGGKIGEPLFLSVDVLQFAALLLAFGTLGAIAFSRHPSTRTASFGLRAIALLVAFVAFCWRFFILTPPMNTALRAYWAAAAAGDNTDAARHQAIFDAGHVTSSRLLLVTLLGFFAATVFGAWNALRGETPRVVVPTAPATSTLEEPALAKAR